MRWISALAYSTDLGVNFTTGWHDRNLFGNAEQLNLTAAAQLGGNAVTKPGYQVGAQFLKPDFLARDQTLELDLNAIKQSLQAYDQTALLEKIALNRKLSPHWTVSLGLSGEQESILQEGVTRHYNLVGIPASLRYDSTTSLLDPTDGIRASLSVTPTAVARHAQRDVLHHAACRLHLPRPVQRRAQRRGAARPGRPGVRRRRFRPAARPALLCRRQRDRARLSLPDAWVRSSPTGSRPAARRSPPEPWSCASVFLAATAWWGFVDVGQVSANGAPFTSNWHAGAGVGARYYTPIGPIRLDVAVPLNKLPGGDSFELYIGIGQAF